MTRDSLRIWLGRGLVGLSLVLLGLWLWIAIDSHTFQSDLARRLAQVVRPGTPSRVAEATRREAGASGLVGRIEIPRLKLKAMIVEGTTDRALMRGVGHVERTAFPGEGGNVALAGHRDTYFRRLKKIADGDTIRVRTPDGDFVYRVDSVLIVKPDRVDLLGPTEHPALTLVTCYPFGWIGSAPDRFIVRASEARRDPPSQGQRASSPSHRPGKSRATAGATAGL
jgi:sortase A